MREQQNRKREGEREERTTFTTKVDPTVRCALRYATIRYKSLYASQQSISSRVSPRRSFARLWPNGGKTARRAKILNISHTYIYTCIFRGWAQCPEIRSDDPRHVRGQKTLLIIIVLQRRVFTSHPITFILHAGYCTSPQMIRSIGTVPYHTIP